MSSLITLETRLRQAPGVAFNQQEEGAVLLHMGDGLYFGLNPVGALIWDALVAEGEVGAALRVMTDRFPDVDPGRIKQDLLHLADELVTKGLLRHA
ncbi:MAG TPA: PqqD family protein [Symbiobacteriaceae bacterium]|nr:PqqD family protein [Symbiobacteriaceae bacterium]